jgi:hypothetical protein
VKFNKKRQNNTWLYVTMLLCLLLALEKCHHQKDLKDQFDLIVTLEQQKDNFEVQINELGAQTATQEVLLIDAKRDYESLLSDFTDLKNTKSQTKVFTETLIDSVFIPVVDIDTIWINQEKFPIYSFQDSTEFYSIAGSVSPNEAILKKISFSNEIVFSQRWERKNILAKKTYFVEVKNSNPYVTIYGVQNYQIEENRRLWEQGKFWFAVGTGVGILIMK